MQINKKFWNNKKVLVTGHTGFKGSWLSVILKHLGANIYGYALNPIGKNNLFNLLKINKILKKDIRNDITNLKILKSFIKKNKPEIIFHLAAQPSVIESFKDSEKTVLTNIVGTANLFEAIKYQNSVKCLVIVTTDKVYQNYKFRKSFDEESILGGDDIYSGSKACCEILTNSYYKSFFSTKNINIATVRAGNCFGGGDFTKDRIVKDCLESFFQNKKLLLRSPMAQRPWQHVIEPLTGYLTLAQKLCSKEGKKFIGPWNFGPSIKQNMKVIDLAKLIQKTIKLKADIIVKKKDRRFINKKIKVFESKYLNINSKKALKRLKWKSKLSIKSAVDLTVDWHKAYISKKNLLKITLLQINNYLK
jgi:CDP-glucose 4,6-dehydratase